MRTIHVSAITDAVKTLCMDANYELEPDMLRAFDRALLKDNAALARDKRIPCCQDRPVALRPRQYGRPYGRGGDLYEDGMKQFSREPS